jgi:hypothetical protein
MRNQKHGRLFYHALLPKNAKWKLLFSLNAIFLMGCSAGCKDNKANTQHASQVAPSSSAPAKAAQMAAFVKNEDVVRKVGAMEEFCKIDVKRGQVYMCQNAELEVFSDWVQKEKPKDLFPTLGVMLVDGKPKRQAVVTAAFQRSFSITDSEWLKINATEVLFQAWEKYVSEQTGPLAEKNASYFSQLLTLRGKEKQLQQLVTSVKNDAVRAQLVQNSMVFGQMTNFPMVQEAARGKSKGMQIAALIAAGKINKPSEQDRKTICSWAKSWLGNEQEEVVTQAGKLLIRCGGDSIEAWLAEGKRRSEKGTFGPPLSESYREICVQPTPAQRFQAVDEARCQQVFQFLESVGNNEKLPASVRGQALWNIYYQRRTKETASLLSKYRKHKNQEIRQKVEDALRSLQESYSVK